ncbi:Ig-like domain-containing protein [Scandinavium sp. V105_16]|uniref:Ig-like domain-containing protein n=1 Tax=Scandinavium lactucae TaxID=3095028 RepID=A0AAJ2S263_9ENTR|nr:MULTISPECIES: BapA/Bap/LapF family large adhesin [unclassified Scandinavium]MDX6020939.1 Ig-like domain-containing protein [Scandinavium sp. V105_16]MDX6032524.1 Ig-like domain-containing protein [Scandinavium sp. V105_12]
MRPFSIISELTGVTSNVEATEVTLSAPSVVKLQLERSDIASITRSGQDMVIKLHSGETLTIHNFYTEYPQGTNQLVLEDSHGALWWVEDTAGDFHFQQIDNLDGFMVAEGHSDGGAIWPWVLGGVAVAAGIGIAAGSGGGGGGGGSDDNSGNGSGNGDGDGNGNGNGGGDNGGDGDGDGGTGGNGGNGGGSTADTTPPTAPTNLTVSPDGTTLTGKAEPGSTVVVKGPDGTIIGKGTAGSDGSFTIVLDKPQISGEQLTVDATDKAGNTGPNAEVTAPNIDLPATPVILSALDDHGATPTPLGNNQITNDNTPLLKGTGTAGSTVHIFQDGHQIGTALVGSDGTWSFAITNALSEGVHSFTAIAFNLKGHSLESTHFTLTIDTVAPDAPQLSAVTDDVQTIVGPLQSGSLTDDARPTLSGKGEVGDTITVYDGQTKLGTTTVDASGNWTFTPSQPLADGPHTLVITQTDPAGNVSGNTLSPTFTVDTTPPNPAQITDVAENGATVTGTAEAGSTVSIYDSNNVLLGSVVVGSNGEFTVTLNPAQTQGQSLEARIQDAAGNVGQPTDFTASDSGFPVQPIIVTVTDDFAPSTGTVPRGGDTNDNTPTLTGTAEPNAIITISDNGTPLAPPVTADANGDWSFTPLVPLTDGDHAFTATATNTAGTSGPSTSFTVDIDTLPPTLSNLAVVGQGQTLTGMTEAGSTVVVKDSLGTQLGTATADQNGNFSITLSTPKTNGESLTVSVTDKAANVGVPETFNVPDITAPNPPSGLVVTPDGLHVTGQAEPNSSITITDGNGNVIGTGTTNGSGNFVATLDTPQLNGQGLLAIATDAANNPSQPASVVAPDTTAPDAPSNLNVNANGTQLTGNAEAGSTVIVKDPDGNVVGTGKADPAGHFTLTLTPAQDNGETLAVTATDLANNTSQPGSALAPDISAPDQPIILQVADDVPGIVGALNSGDTTNDSQPTLTGKAEAGSTVQVYENGNLLGNAILDGNGNWSFTPGSPLSEGSHQFIVKSTDAGGNSSSSAPFNVLVDTVAPQVPAITLVNDDAPGILGPVANTGLTNDSTPTISGTGQPGSVVHLFDNGGFVADITVTPTGTWSYTFTTPLTGNAHSLTVNASDDYGNTSADSAAWTFTLDTSAPNVPVYTDVTNSGGTSIDTGQLTNETQPHLSGSGDVGSVITIYDNGVAIGQVTVDGLGEWEFTPPLPLADNKTHILTATATDEAGNESAPASYTLIVDATAPDAPIIVSATIEGSNGDIVLANGSVTKETEPLLSGNAEPNSSVTLYNNGAFLATVPTDGNGAWSYLPGTGLTEGLHVITATATDAAGNTSALSGGFSVQIDLTAPGIPAAPLVTDNVLPVVGNIADNGSTNDTTPTFSGTGEVGSTITIYNGTDILGTALVNESGNWSWTPGSPLPLPSYVITTTATDPAGNTSAHSPSVSFTIDTDVPNAPVISYAEDDVGLPVQVTTGGTTDDNTPVLHGTAEIGSTVSIFNGSSLVGTAVADSSGNWSLALGTLTDNTYTFTAVATDKAGNPSGASNSFTLTVDTEVLLPPVVEQIVDNVGVIQGNLTNGMFTDDQTLVISGTGQNGTTVVIYDNGVELGTAVVSNGQWSFPTPTLTVDPLTETQHSFTFTTRDGGEETAPTAPIVITVDVAPPADPVVNLVSPDGTNVSGTAEANSTVIIKNAAGDVIGQGAADAGGNFNVTLSPAQTGGQTLTAIDQDRAGNQSGGVDFTASNSGLPDVPVITQILDNVDPVTGAIAAGGSTDDTTPTLSGTADANATVHIYIDGNPIEAGSVVANGSGNWSFTIPADLLEGTHSFTVSASNGQGTGGLSAPTIITVDLTAPLAPFITDATDDVPANVGTLGSGQLTNDLRPTLNGIGEPNATITVYDNGVEIGTATANGSGNWSFTPTADLTSTSHDFTVTATDAAGHTGPLSGIFTLNIDAVAPTIPAITSVANDNGTLPVAIPSGGATNDTQPLIGGTGEIGSTITVYDNGTVLGTATVDGSGNWSLPAPTALVEGAHNLTVTATDAAGNTTAQSAPFPIVIDTAPPAVPTLLTVVDDQPGVTGPLVNGQLTNDTTPTLNGRGEAGATIKVFSDGVLVGSGTVDGTGAWSVTPTTPLTNGTHLLTVSQTDPAGNVSAATGGFTVNVDATVPVAPVITSVADNTAPVIGVVPNGGSTNETHPAISGTGEAGSTITLYNGAAVLGTTTVNAGGNWSFTPTTALTSGTWTITATATDAAGNTGPASDIRSFTVDTAAPTIPTITTVFDDQGPVTGNLTSGAVTDDARPAISGTSEANASVKIYDGGNLVTTVTADGNGAWSWTPTSALTQGSHLITVTATDAAGNVSLSSNSFTFVVDSQAPLAPVITSLTDDVTPVTGPIVSGQSTNDSTPTLSGTAEVGATVNIYDGTTLVGTTTADAQGNWIVTTSTLGDGPHTLTAKATDAAGNLGPSSAGFAITIDTSAPVVPVLQTVSDDVTGGVVGTLTNGQLTNDNKPTLTGTAEAGSTVSIYDGSTLLGTTVATGGSWSFTPGTALTDGSHTLTVTATDAAGNISPATGSFAIVVDATLPVTPVITTIVDDVPNIVGAVGNGQPTNDTLPTLNGTAEANSTVRIYDNGALVTTVTANGSGNWAWTPTTALAQGSHSYTVTSTDAAGNLSATSGAAAIVVDTVAPGAPTNLAANSTGTRITGTAEANSTVTITSSTGTVLGTATADGTGAFTVNISPAQTSGQPLLAFAQDKAGNVGGSTPFTAPDTRLPDAPTITSVVDDVANYTGAIANGQLTNDPTPTLSGLAQANSTVNIYNNGTLLGTTTANASGAWSFTPTANMTEGSHAFTATATNANGTGAASSSISINIDTTAPSAPGITISADGSTLSGTAEANSTVTITLPNGAGTLTATAGSDGNWTLTLPVRQIEGQLLTATATDVAGNTSGPGSVTAPSLPLSAGDNITNLALTSTATTTTEHLTDYGLLLVGALGNVASVLGNDTAQVTFNIDNGGSGDVTIDAAATGIVLSLLSTQEIVVQRFDTASGSWQTFINTSNPDFANLLTLTGSGVTLNLTGLTGGQYRVLTYNSSLLATGSYTSLDVDVHKTSAGSVSGPTTETGNVITDQDPTGGLDNAPAGTTVTQVTNANGVVTTVGAGGADIVGLYGTLHINQDGSYTYTLTNTSAAVLGHKESFTYTITHNGVSDSAQLVVTLGPVPPASTVVTADDSASLVFNTNVEAVNNGASSQSGFTVVGVGLGNVLNLDVLASMSNPIKFDVEDGSTRTMTLQSSVGGVALASTFDLYIYRFNDITQQYEQYQVQKGWLNAPLLGGQSSQLTLTLPGGEYVFLLNTASGVTALTGYTLNILQDHTYAVDSLTASTTGNVLGNDVLPAGALLTEVNGVAVSPTGITTINGLYGTLTINAQGNYTYTLKNGVGADGIKTPDSFVYTVKAANGDTDTASLNITPTPHALDAVNDTSAVMAVSTAHSTGTYSDLSVGSAQWNNPLIGTGSGSGSGNFTVDANTLLQGATLHFNIASALALAGLSGTWSITQNGSVIQNGTYSGTNTNINIADLGAGSYTLNFTGTTSGIGILGSYTVTPTVTGTSVNLDNYISNNANTVHGNIFDGTDAAGATDQLASVHTTLSITGAGSSTASLDPAASASSATVLGKYGSLQFNLDGSYTYTLNNGVAVSSINSKETFTYTLNDHNGHTDTATLTINMNPQMASTGQHDVLTGSAYGDTLIYHLLKGSDATGGNGNDEWTNFNLAQGDKIDLRELLTGWDHQASTLGNFIQVNTNGSNTVISVDRDGTGSTYHSTALITLDSVQTNLTELLQQNHIITG